MPYKKLGGGDIVKGFEQINQMPYFDARKLVNHPVACIDCHDSQTMALRVTRPAFMEGMRALKAGQGVPDYDVNTMATRQEMRAFVCGQCHVEYYFKGPEKRLTYPWSKGLKVDDILQYYDENPHDDWTHAESGAKVLKAQHPEFEMWNQGIHARSGVACADCHMPYMRVGALKISDHHVRSPVLNINNACQTCHKWPEEELRARIETIQGRVFGLRNRAMDAVVALITDIKEAAHTGCVGGRARPAAPTAAPRAVHAGLRRSGKLHRIPCPPGGGADPGRVDRLRASGSARAARRERAGAANDGARQADADISPADKIVTQVTAASTSVVEPAGQWSNPHRLAAHHPATTSFQQLIGVQPAKQILNRDAGALVTEGGGQRTSNAHPSQSLEVVRYAGSFAAALGNANGASVPFEF